MCVCVLVCVLTYVLMSVLLLADIRSTPLFEQVVCLLVACVCGMCMCVCSCVCVYVLARVYVCVLKCQL